MARILHKQRDNVKATGLWLENHPEFQLPAWEDVHVDSSLDDHCGADSIVPAERRASRVS